jgi:hypothetical protein
MAKKKPAETKVLPWGDVDRNNLADLIRKGKVDIDRTDDFTISKESIRIIFHTATNVTSFVTSEISPRRGILKLHATEQGKKTAKVSRNNIIASSHVKLIISFLTPPSDNSSSDGDIDDDNNNSSSSEDSSNMVKTTAKTTAKTTTKKKKGGLKTTGLSDDDGPTKKKTKVEVKAKLYSIDVVKPYTQQQEYAKDTDDIIDGVLVVDGVPDKKAEPKVTLESDGMKLKVLWKTPNVELSLSCKPKHRALQRIALTTRHTTTPCSKCTIMASVQATGTSLVHPSILVPPHNQG